MTTDVDPLDPEHIPEGMVQLADGRLVGRKTVTAGDEVLVDPQTEERADTDASLEADPADPEAVAERMDALTGTAIPENEGVDTGTDTPAYTGPQTRSERTPTVREQQAESKHQPQQPSQRSSVTTAEADGPKHIQPAPHEADVFLWFDEHGVSPYWAFADALINHVEGNSHTLTSDLDGDTWQIEFTCSRSGIAPRPQDNVDVDVAYEYELSIDGPNHRSIHYNISPRSNDMRGPDDPVVDLLGARHEAATVVRARCDSRVCDRDRRDRSVVSVRTRTATSPRDCQGCLAGETINQSLPQLLDWTEIFLTSAFPPNRV